MMLGRHGRTYAFRVRATDVHGNTSAWRASPRAVRGVPDALRAGGFGRVRVDGLKMRSSPSLAGSIMTRLAAGAALRIIGGPVRRDGYTWFRVSGPIRQWGPVDRIEVGGWVAAFGNGARYVLPRRPVYATRVDAGLTGLRLADGGPRVLTPNADGRQDTLPLTWTNRRNFAAITLRLFRTNGRLVGTVELPPAKTDRGARRWAWDGRIGGARVPAGAYIVQLQGRRSGQLFHAPSASVATGGLIGRFGVVVGPAAPTSVLRLDGPATLTNARSLTWRLRFGGPVGALTARDFSVSGSANGCRVGTPGGSGAAWSVTLSGCSAGTVTLSLRGGAVVDAVGNRGPSRAVQAPLVRIDRSAPSTTAPKVMLRRDESLVSGSSTTGLLAVVSWFGTDRGIAGVRGYDLRRSTDGGPWVTVATNITGMTRGVPLAPDHGHRFAVRARDRAGNVGPWIAGSTVVAQLRQETWDAVTWRGARERRTAAAFSGGSVRSAMERGASFSVTFTGRGIAWVSTLGPSRGAARVYLDGLHVATIDTHSASMLYRRVVFARTWSTLGTHTLRVVAVGSAGHPRVDLDALEVLR
jgi:hypothetical protein